MTAEAEITVQEAPADEDIRARVDGVLRFNETVAGPNDGKPLGVFARDARGRIVVPEVLRCYMGGREVIELGGP